MRGNIALILCFVAQLSLAQVLTTGKSEALRGAALTLVQSAEDTLSVLARGVLVSELAENRMYACHQLIPGLVKALKTPNSFQYKFPRLENISIQYPQDSTFRIFSWQLKINEGEYRYFGAIQWNQTALKLIPLVDRTSLILDPLSATVPANNWYGVVYYGIRSFKPSDQQEAYLLFGYDGYNQYEHRKVIDILSFKDGQPYFGAPIFKFSKNLIQSRVIYQYGADAAVRVNYDEHEKMIVCDHLMKKPGLLPGQGNVMVPEGSYEGFKLEKGIWKYVEDVFPSGNAENQRAYRTKPKKVELKNPIKNQ